MGTRRGAALVAALTAALAPLAPLGPASAHADASEDLYLVTLAGPGTTGLPAGVPDLLATTRLQAEQNAVLATVGNPEPVYRWTTALNGVAVRLTAADAADLASDDAVALVEKDAVRPLAGVPQFAAGTPGSPGARTAAPAW